MLTKISVCLFTLLASLIYLPFQDILSAQDTWANDFRNMMEIRSIKAVESSPAHMYVLSESEGLVVFRTNADTLQWLYSSSGMEQRGDKIQADVRFAYLYGDSRRLTIVEPTSVLGVYSSTSLPHQPRSVQRLGNSVYIAMGNNGLGRLSLESPDDVDSDPEILLENEFGGREVLDLVSDLVSRLYVLVDGLELYLIDRTDSDDQIELNRTVRLDRRTDRVFLTSDELIGTDENGIVFLIDSNGSTSTIADVEAPVNSLRIWGDQLVVQTVDNRLWIGDFGEQPELWKIQSESGNYFTVANGQLWVSEFNRLSPVVRVASEQGSQLTDLTDQEPEIKPIEDITIPFPRPLILPIELSSNHNVNDIEFSYRSNIENAMIRGQSFYWQPTASQIGRHEFIIAATTTSGLTGTVSFTVDVRPFNTPPRFTPLQPITINVDEEFRLEINAVDPDGIDSDLIRYLGVDMPSGASLDEKTGEFRWTPSIRQVGEFEFQVIATDQFGAATSRDIEIRVIETNPEEEADIEIQ